MPRGCRESAKRGWIVVRSEVEEDERVEVGERERARERTLGVAWKKRSRRKGGSRSRRRRGWAARVLSLITSQDGQERETPVRMLRYAATTAAVRWCGERAEEAGSLVAGG